jgi:prolyl-tRNA synthetase
MAKKTIFNIDKDKNFSEWYTEIVQKAELGDIRYNIKGFIVFQPWSVLSMEKMYHYMELVLRRKNHQPHWFPTVIPEKNFNLEADHVKGFSPQVFWVTGAGDDKFDERLALRPTSETAFYQMFSLWIRSYKDLPFKAYQKAKVFRYETSATRPFLRSREFHWIETHCAHASKDDAEKQVLEDMETTKEVLHDIFGLPFIFFKRPQWDKFHGAENTYAADVLNPDGKFVQQPSTHIIKQEFAKAFDVKFMDKDEKEKYVWTTCYGPAISRIFASVIITHGDNKGLIFPWKIAPTQVIIVPIGDDKEVKKQAEEISKQLTENNIYVSVDNSDKSMGEKFYYWEMKGVPLRIEFGKKELEKNELTIFRRDKGEKETIKTKDILKYINKTSKEIDKGLIKKADSVFNNRIVDVIKKDQIKKELDNGKVVRCGFCTIDKQGEKCGGIIEKDSLAQVRGTKLGEKHDKKFVKCIICGKKANETVYIGRQY